MATSNYQFDDGKIARLVENDFTSEDLRADIKFEAPTADGEGMAVVSITRTYRLNSEDAKKLMTLAL